MEIAAALAEVQRNIEMARQHSPNPQQPVMLLAVSKTHPIAAVNAAAAAGQTVFAENRVQEMIAKQEQRPDLSWHLIGHLQTNKVKYMIDKTALLHSLDSYALAQEIEKRAAAKGLVLPVLVQVNIAEDENKFGIRDAEVADFLDAMADFSALQVQGLMTIGPFLDEAEEMRPVFRALRQTLLRERAKPRPQVDLRHLSMGMSHDYMVAIEEGADMVRVGSSIFGARNYAV